MALLARPIAAILVVTALALPAAASATVTPAVTAQAQAADAAFLAYAPPPSGPPGALCIVDTGVASTPDTAPGLLGSYSIAAPSAQSPQDVDPHGHGTIEAMIAGAAGAQGMIGAWPRLHTVSVQATTSPGAGQEPTYQFSDYYQGMGYCYQYAAQDHIKAVLLALNSMIPPSPDQAQQFSTVLAELNAEGIAVVASAGNYADASGGPALVPASQPGVFVVGASTAQPGSLSNTPVGSPCNFSARQGVTIYAPGCGLTQATPFSDQPQQNVFGDGTSQAAAVAAASLVALMSYDPALSYQQAEQLLVQTATGGGDLDVTAAFDAAGLESVVAQGNAGIPLQSTGGATGASGSAGAGGGNSGGAGSRGRPGAAHGHSHQSPRPGKHSPRLKRLHWALGVLTLTLTGTPKDAVIQVTLMLGHGRTRTLTADGLTITLATPRPLAVRLRVLLHGRAVGATISGRP
ncbi:MAG: S8/S53 family peptidase [Solirubrobacteraceae bacterium]